MRVPSGSGLCAARCWDPRFTARAGGPLGAGADRRLAAGAGLSWVCRAGSPGPAAPLCCAPDGDPVTARKTLLLFLSFGSGWLLLPLCLCCEPAGGTFLSLVTAFCVTVTPG